MYFHLLRFWEQNVMAAALVLYAECTCVMVLNDSKALVYYLNVTCLYFSYWGNKPRFLFSGTNWFLLKWHFLPKKSNSEMGCVCYIVNKPWNWSCTLYDPILPMQILLNKLRPPYLVITNRSLAPWGMILRWHATLLQFHSKGLEENCIW